MTSNFDKNAFSALNQQQLNSLSSAAAALNKEQLIWASGYLAGLAGAVALPASVDATSQTAAAEQASLTILFGSQTGNAKGVANKYKAQLNEKGINANVISMADYKPRSIKNETHLLVIVSTHGEGDAPDDAVEFHEFLASKKAPKLPNLQYAVIGLGDTSYEFFCQTAKDFDQRLAALGATALAERLDCDVDYDSAIAEWAIKIEPRLIEQLKPVATTQVTPAAAAVSSAISQESLYNKQNPFAATLSETLKITGRDSIKDIRHIEISLEDSGISYQPGDALGVYFLNDQAIVERILKVTDNSGNSVVTLADGELSLQQALTDRLELTLSYPGFVKSYQAATGDTALAALMADKTALREFLNQSQIVDVVEQFPAKIDAQALVDALRPISPRLYSIASSQAEVEDEVHLTVAHVEYEAYGYAHQGGASGYLSTRLEEGAEVKVYVESNENFRLPADDQTPVIMIGPGTGIAPFRAFMQERDARDAAGKNWLLFGNPSFTQDFLYQTEWQGYLKSGLLTKISLAFSRDQAQKIYVQDRLLENAKEVFEWLESGAHIYVCGDATRMAKDVESALLEIIKTQGNKSEQDAKIYLTAMRKAKRYQKDVY